MLIDTHTHLYVKQFDSDRDEMVRRAIDAGVERMYLPNIDKDSIAGMLALEEKFPNHCFSMIGIHPCDIKEDYEDQLAAVKHWLDKRKFVAVGEIGLDYYWSKDFIPQQKDAFRRQIKWAKEFNIPIAIHARDSMQDCIQLVKSEQDGTLRGVFHCFTGSMEQAKEIIKLNFYMGIGGVLTYPKAGIAEVVQAFDLKHFILETDAPYLTPVPFRGKRNESAYIRYVAEKMAELKGISVEEVEAITTENALELFGR